MVEQAALAKAQKIDWSEVPEDRVSGGVLRRVVQTQTFTMVHYTYPPHATFKLHQHPEAQLTYVVRGQIVFDVDGEKQDLEPGDWLYIPGGAPHSAKAGSSGPVVAMNIFSPRRDDFPTGQ